MVALHVSVSNGFGGSMGMELAPSDTASWVRFLQKVDDTPADEVLIQTVADWLVNLNFANPGYAAGYTSADLCKVGADAPLESPLAEALLDRAMILLNRRAEAKSKAQNRRRMLVKQLREEIHLGGYYPILPSYVPRSENTRRSSASKADRQTKSKVHDHIEEVCIHVLSHAGVEYVVPFQPRQTVQQLKKALADPVGVPLQQVGLALGCTVIGEDDCLLEDYGIEAGARLSLFIELQDVPEEGSKADVENGSSEKVCA